MTWNIFGGSVKKSTLQRSFKDDFGWISAITVVYSQIYEYLNLVSAWRMFYPLKEIIRAIRSLNFMSLFGRINGEIKKRASPLYKARSIFPDLMQVVQT